MDLAFGFVCLQSWGGSSIHSNNNERAALYNPYDGMIVAGGRHLHHQQLKYAVSCKMRYYAMHLLAFYTQHAQPACLGCMDTRYTPAAYWIFGYAPPPGGSAAGIYDGSGGFPDEINALPQEGRFCTCGGSPCLGSGSGRPAPATKVFRMHTSRGGNVTTAACLVLQLGWWPSRC